MLLETWLTLTIAGAFFLLGIAGSPLAWAMLHLRRSRFEERMERRWQSVLEELRAMDSRLNRYEWAMTKSAELQGAAATDSPHRRGAHPALEKFGQTERAAFLRSPSTASGQGLKIRADATHEPPLIAVPNLEEAVNDRDAAVSGLKERYAAIWALADTGATADVIARATGQPVGQIELILGLRKRIDGN